MIFTIRNYFSKFVDKETTPKYYFNDNGLLNLFLNKEEPRLLENLVAINISSDKETKSLVEVAKSVKDAKRFVIITYEEEKQLTVDGVMIEIIPVWKWLIKNFQSGQI